MLGCMSATVSYDVRMRPTFIPDADFSSNSVTPGRCLISNSPRRKEDKGIFRIGQIDMERGWIEVSENGIGEMAQKIGWIHPDAAGRLKAEIADLKSQVKELSKLAANANVETVVELSTKLASERRKTRRYKKRINKLEGREEGPLQEADDDTEEDS